MAAAELLEEHGFEQEEMEFSAGSYRKTNFPKPIKRFRIVWEAYNLNMEEAYFWTLNTISQDRGYAHVIKTEDAFAASENSSFFGITQQRLGAQQDKASQYLATIGKMVKELFQLVRELRIIDERLEYYDKSKKGQEAAEITLKGIWIDMVEGGSKNASSVYGLAREVGFTTLPDLFFSTHPRTKEKVDEYVDRLKFNRKVREVLKRKLYQYLVWKEKTEHELKSRKNFTLKYLRQHYDIIKMYMTWAKPYLRHVKRMTLNDEKTLSPDLVAAFEGSMTDVEFLAVKNNKEGVQPCVLAHFEYRTRPITQVYQQEYQRGPVYIGRVDMTFRAYAWDKKQRDAYVKMKEKEDLDLLKTVSDSVKTAMEALGGDIEKYLEEAGEKIKTEEKKPEKEKKKTNFLEQLRAEFLGPKQKKEKKEKKLSWKDEQKLKSGKSKAIKEASKMAYFVFRIFKKAHGMVQP